MDQFNHPYSLQGKRVLVTGASSGIGQGIAVFISQIGAQVIIVGRNNQRLDETLSKMNGVGHKSIVCDITKSSDLSQMVNSLPKLDGIVHCAGIGQRILCKQLVEEDIDRVMNVNFKATVLRQSELLRQKRINKGASVVFISSMAAEMPSLGNSVYSASKGAIISFAKCLSLELAPRDIRVNCISPAMVWTKLITDEGIDEELLREEERQYPLRRYGSPTDIAGLAGYLLSDTSSWMTGSVLKITGGAIKL